jgi:STE24 endopeptidase
MDTPTTGQDPVPVKPPPASQPATPLPETRDVKAYHRIKRRLHIVGLVISILYFLAWMQLMPELVGSLPGGISKWAALAIGALTMFGGLVVLTLPLDYYDGYTIEQRYGLSNQTPAGWLWFQVKAWLIGVILLGVLLGGLYALLWFTGRLWSVWLWVGVMTLSVVLAKVFPLIILPLFYPAKPLDRPSLTERLQQLASGSGMTITGVFDLALSKDTKKANAMLTGLGSSRRVYLSDTLLEAFTDDQIAVVFAHELGHHMRKHIWKGIGLTAVLSSITVALIHWRLNPFAGGLDPADWRAAVSRLAQIAFIATAFPLLISPLTNAISRRFERQCDSDALRLTKDREAYRSAFQQLSRVNMADPDPPRWEEILFHDHPALSKRIAMADRN